VLDPYCGSGTTCVAAKELSRNYLGIELNPKYCEMAQRRINNTQESMF
jgi:DNA modification methylase